jgi:hypothetical protein
LLLADALVLLTCRCLVFACRWVNPIANFDNILNAMVTLFSISTTELWVDTTMAAVDAVGPELQPITNHNPGVAVFFVVFVCFGAFFILQLFVSVTLEKVRLLAHCCYNLLHSDIGHCQDCVSATRHAKPQLLFSSVAQASALGYPATVHGGIWDLPDRLCMPGDRGSVHAAYSSSCLALSKAGLVAASVFAHPSTNVLHQPPDHIFPCTLSCCLLQFGEIAKGGSAMLTAKQEQWLTIQRMMAATDIEVQPQPPQDFARLLLYHLVTSQAFEAVVIGFIMANMVLLAMTHQGMNQAWQDAMSYANLAFTVVFAMEALLKLVAFGPWQYIRVRRGG